MPTHPQLTRTSKIDDYVIPFSKTLLLLEELGTDAGLAIEAAQMKLYGLESPLLLENLHDNNLVKAARLPMYEELYQEGIDAAMPIQELPSHTPTLRRKPNGLVQRSIIPEKKSCRQLALEALMLRVGVDAVCESKPRPRLFIKKEGLCAARRRAIEALAQKGWDMRQFCYRGRAQLIEKRGGKYGCAHSFIDPREGPKD